jgi:hypothetical protein
MKKFSTVALLLFSVSASANDRVVAECFAHHDGTKNLEVTVKEHHHRGRITYSANVTELVGANPLTEDYQFVEYKHPTVHNVTHVEFVGANFELYFFQDRHLHKDGTKPARLTALMNGKKRVKADVHCHRY